MSVALEDTPSLRCEEFPGAKSFCAMPDYRIGRGPPRTKPDVDFAKARLRQI